jgi:NADP-dependent 3-hydroxy acid dehydrogenase YdfG
VVATGRRPEQLHGLVPAHGDQVRCHSFAVTDPVTADQAVRFAVEKFGGIDIADSLVAIAASARRRSLLRRN